MTLFVKVVIEKSSMPLLRIADLRADNYKQFINEKEVPKKCIANENDIIYTRTGQVGLVFRVKRGSYIIIVLEYYREQTRLRINTCIIICRISM